MTASAMSYQGTRPVTARFTPDRQEHDAERERHDEGVVLLLDQRDAEPFQEVDVPQQRADRHGRGHEPPGLADPGLHLVGPGHGLRAARLALAHPHRLPDLISWR